MNILFSFTCKNRSQQSDCCAIAHILRTDNNRVILRSDNKRIKNEACFNNFDIYSEDEHVDFDIVVVYTKSGLQQVTGFAVKKHLPIIYVIDAQNFESEYPDDISNISRTIVFGNTQNIPPFLIRKDLTNTFVSLFPAYSTEKQEKENVSKVEIEVAKNERKKFLIDTTANNLHYSPIYRLMPLCNILPNADITVLYDDMPPVPMFNTNVKLQQKQQTDILSLISECDIVIGSEDIIHHGIYNEKPCIVVGEKGYGGIISPQNIFIQCSNNFQGRIGGYIDEYIPENLLQDDLKTLMQLDDEKRHELLENNKTLLDEMRESVVQQWQTIMHSAIDLHNSIETDLLNCNLKLSSDLLLLPFPGEKFLITNGATRQVHSNFGKSEADIIALFREPKTVKTALNESEYRDDEEMFTEFIGLLVNEKILICHEQQK